MRSVVAACFTACIACLTLAAPAAVAATYSVDPSIADTSASDPCTSPCALRQAVSDANVSSDATNVINMPAGTYTLTQGALPLDPMSGTSLILAGQGTRASDVIITAAGASQVLNVGGTGIAAANQLEITGGSASVGGGAYVNPNASLVLLDALVAGNTATNSGGGIDTNGALTVNDSTIASNSVTAGLAIGGGIDNFAENGAGVTISNSTIANNTVSGGSGNTGGGINNGSTLHIVDSTIAGNGSPSGQAAGLAGGATAMLDTIIAANSGGTDCGATPPTSSGHNLDDDGSCSLSAAGDQSNVSAGLVTSSGHPVLTNNGGPTDTIALQPTSTAVDAGFATPACQSPDQRGVTRPDPEDTGASPPCDIGAYESSPGPPPSVITGFGTSVDPNSETLSGQVNPNGQSTTYHFDYATDSYYTTHGNSYSSASPSASAGSGATLEAVEAPLSGLTPSTTYDFRLVATNANGTANGADAQFTTAAASGGTGGGGGGGTTTPPAAPDLALAVSHLDPFKITASNASYHVTAVNQGTGPTSGGVQLSATLPPGITYKSASAGWSCSAPSAQAIACTYTGAPIAPGASASLDIAVSVSTTSTGGAASFTLSDPGDSDSADKNATDLTNVSGPGTVLAALTGSGALLAGASGNLTLSIANRTHAALSPGTSVTLRVPSGTPAGFDLSPHAGGAGWMCATIAIYGVDIIHCAQSGAIAAGADAPALVLSLEAPATPRPNGPVQIGYEGRSAGGALLAGPQIGQVRVLAPEHARLSLGLRGAAKLTAQSQGYELDVSDPGSGATSAPTVVSVKIPSQVTSSAASGSGWACSSKPGGFRCVFAQPLGSGGTAAPLVFKLSGTPGAASPVTLQASATSSDLAGALSAHAALALDQPSPGEPHPALSFTSFGPGGGAGGAGGAGGTTGYFIRVTNTGTGAAGSQPLIVKQTLPPGVTVGSTAGSGWSCGQKKVTLTCQFTPLAGGTGQSVLKKGGETPPLTVTFSHTGSFAGGAVPVTSLVSLTSKTGITHTTTGSGQVAIAGLQGQAASSLLSVDPAATPAGATVQATFGIVNSSAADISTPTAVALVLPADLSISPGILSPTPDVISPAPGSNGAATVPVSPGAGPGMSCRANASNVVCVTSSLAAGSQTTVTVPVVVAAGAGGIETLTAGTVHNSGGSLLAQQTAASTVVRNVGAAALAGPSTFALTVLSWVPDAGTDQTLPGVSQVCQATGATGQAASIRRGAKTRPPVAPISGTGALPTVGLNAPAGCSNTATPTTVQLDASKTQDNGAPLSYAWVQTAGPPVTWAASAQGETPGLGASTLPQFPSGAFTSSRPSQYVSYPPPGHRVGGSSITASPQAYGPRPTFTYSRAASLTSPVALAFELFVTDGSLVKTTSTTVTLNPPPPAPPVAPQLCMWDLTQTTTQTIQTCLTNTSKPAAGDTVVAGPLVFYTKDAAGHALSYTWALTQPGAVATQAVARAAAARARLGAVIASAGATTAPNPRIGPITEPTVPFVCRAVDAYCFSWPAGASVVSAQATITNGQLNAEGQPEQTVAVVSAGAAPPPLAVSITAPSTPAVAGSTVNLDASGNYQSYKWTQTGGPTVAGPVAQGARLSFAAPAPTAGSQTVTFLVTATQAFGAGSSSGTATATISLLPAPPLGVSVTSGTTANPKAAPFSVANPGGTIALNAAGAGGAGRPYTYSWSAPSGGGRFSLAHAASTVYTAPASAGVEQLRLKITDGTGASTTQTIPVAVGASSPSSATGACGQASLSLGPVTIQLGAPDSGSAGCSSLASGGTLTYSAGTAQVGPFTLTQVKAKLSSSGIELDSATITAPSTWHLGSGTISQNIVVPFGGSSSPSGAITWTGALPWLATPGASPNATTTVTLNSDGTVKLHASATIAGAAVTFDTDPFQLSGGAINATVTVTKGSGSGPQISGTGTVAVAADGTVTPTVNLTVSNLKVPGVTVNSAQLTWDSAGLALTGSLTLPDSIQVNLNGSYQDSDNWSATATAAISSDPAGLPSGVHVKGASLVGTVSEESGGPVTFDVKATAPNPWTFSPGGTKLFSINTLAIEFSNLTAPANCPASITGGSIWLQLSGAATISIPSLRSVDVSGSVCVDPSSGAFSLNASGLDNFTPFPAVPVTLDGLSLTIAYDPAVAANNGISFSAKGALSVDGVTAKATLTTLPDGGIAVLGALTDVSQLGLPIPSGTTAAVIVTSEEIPDLSTAPAALFPPEIHQHDLQGVAVQADSVAVLADIPLGAPPSDPRKASALQCLLDQSVYQNPCGAGDAAPTGGGPQAPGNVVVSADIGNGIPTITASLPLNGLEVLCVGRKAGTHGPSPLCTPPDAQHPSSYVALDLKSVFLQLSLDGSFAIGGEVTLLMPAPTGGGEQKLDLAADISLDPVDQTISMAATVGPACKDAPPGSTTQSALCDIFGVPGLDLGAVSLQLGIDFSTSPIPTPTVGFAATIDAIPCKWANAIGDSQKGCSGANGTPDPTAGTTEPFSIAVNLSDTGPLFALQLGVKNGNPVLQFGNNAIKVDDASIVIAPVGGTIGAGPNAVTFQPGLSLDFDAQVLGVPVSVHAAVDPEAPKVSASAAVGTITAGPLTLQNAMFNFTVDSSGVNAGFSGGVNVAGATLQGSAAVQVGTGGANFNASLSGAGISLGSAATLAGLNLGGAVTLNDLNLNASAAVTDAGATPSASLDLNGSASATVLGQTMALAGTLSVSGSGIQKASFVADPGTLNLGGLNLSGPGCGSAGGPGFPAGGPCVSLAYDPSASTPLSVALNATATFSGVGVTFDGTFDPTGVDIEGTAFIYDPFDHSGPNRGPSRQTIGSLKGHLWLGAACTDGTQKLCNVTAADPNGATGSDPNTIPQVQVHPGDFEVSGIGNLTLDGFDVNGNFTLGSLAVGASGGPSIFASGEMNVQGLGGSANVMGSFGSDGSGNYTYDLKGSGSALSLDGYPLASGTLELSSQTGLTVSASVDLAPLVTGTVRGNLNMHDGTLLYSVSGGGTAHVLDSDLAANVAISNENPDNTPSGTVSVSDNYDNRIAFNGTASFGTDGTVCNLSGSLSVFGATGTASYCGGADPAISLSISYAGATLSGTATSHSFSLTTGAYQWDLPGSGSFLLVNYSGDLTLKYQFNLGFDASRGVSLGANPNPSFGVSGEADLTGSVGPVTASAKGAVSGTPDHLCGTANIVSTDFTLCYDNGRLHFTAPKALAS